MFALTGALPTLHFTQVLVVQNTSHLHFWQAPAYYALWAVQRTVLVLYWMAVIYYSFQAFDARLYDANYVLDYGKKKGNVR